jgi:hypothetical protein
MFMKVCNNWFNWKGTFKLIWICHLCNRKPSYFLVLENSVNCIQLPFWYLIHFHVILHFLLHAIVSALLVPSLMVKYVADVYG